MATKPAKRQSIATASSTAERLEVNYRQLRIVAGVQNGRGKAIAYQGGKKLLEVEGADASSAVAHLKAAVDELHARRESLRTQGIPSAEEYADALLRVDRFISPLQHAALSRHAARPGAWASFGELARQLGTEAVAIQREYVRLGRYLGDILNFKPASADLPKRLQPVLAVVELVEDDGEAAWVLRPNFLAALKKQLNKPTRGSA